MFDLKMALAAVRFPGRKWHQIPHQDQDEIEETVKEFAALMQALRMSEHREQRRNPHTGQRINIIVEE